CLSHTSNASVAQDCMPLLELTTSCAHCRAPARIAGPGPRCRTDAQSFARSAPHVAAAVACRESPEFAAGCHKQLASLSVGRPSCEGRDQVRQCNSALPVLPVRRPRHCCEKPCRPPPLGRTPDALRTCLAPVPTTSTRLLRRPPQSPFQSPLPCRRRLRRAW